MAQLVAAGAGGGPVARILTVVGVILVLVSIVATFANRQTLGKSDALRG